MDISLFDKLFRDGLNWLEVIKFTAEVMMRDWFQIWVIVEIASLFISFELLYIFFYKDFTENLEKGLTIALKPGN